MLCSCGDVVDQWPNILPIMRLDLCLCFLWSSHISNRNIIYTDIQNNEISNARLSFMCSKALYKVEYIIQNTLSIQSLYLSRTGTSSMTVWPVVVFQFPLTDGRLQSQQWLHLVKWIFKKIDKHCKQQQQPPCVCGHWLLAHWGPMR